MTQQEHNPKMQNKKYILADLVLWKELSGRKILNYLFSRNEIVENRRVDYYCQEKKFVMLLSGEFKGVQTQTDIETELELEGKGYKVFRVNYLSVLNDLPSVIEEIKVQILK
ncbi:MAG: DUF559 domain-containing protein [Sphingobacteriales bacterium]|nr:MAG: DUF559 domain-containing protein [Sphingobacteriales bacterium]